MKKILFAAFSLVSMLFIASCSNEDITIDKTLPKHSVSYSVSTQGMYDTFGIVDDVRNDCLRDNSSNVGVLTYLYDAKGELIDSKITTLNNFNIAQQTFDNLEEGQYTFVTIETLVNPDNENKPYCWRIYDMEKLSTAKISQFREDGKSYYPTEIFDVLGVSTEIVSVSNDVSVTVYPKALGSIVHFYCFNFDKSEYANLAFGTKDIINYYILDPKVEGGDKFYKNTSEDNKFNYRCGLPAANSNGKGVSAYVLEHDIEWYAGYQNKNMEGTDNWILTYPENNNKATLEMGANYYMGYYYYEKNGDDYVGIYFGDYDGFILWKKNMDDYVSSLELKLFEEPYLNWGSSVSDVRTNMSAYEEFGLVPLEDLGYLLVYYGKNKVGEIDYYFRNQTSDLYAARLLLDSQIVGEDEIYKAFEDFGYTYFNSGDNFTTYKKDSKTYIEVGLNINNFWYVFYYDPNAPEFSQQMQFNRANTLAPSWLNNKNNKVNTFDFNSLKVSLRICENAISNKIVK